ncbi:MAG: Hsp20/alpha crystallin family protein [Gemmatimonadetes bacterium]|nr:Hsp20/alpha crystallin family protein [Gemmatimonadota bacterium]MDA1103071.1 Hsp20/alpha crystallin family protein [Gemmatimonadota bacterium]
MAIMKYAFRRPAFSAWRDLDEAPNRLGRLFDDTALFPGAREGHWIPPVSVAENVDALTLTAELPGLKEEDISIELENNVLTISGEKVETRTEDDEEARYHIWERSFGSFSRSFTLPRTVDGSDVEATFEGGVLSIKLPKVSESKGRRIEIKK